MCLCPGVFCPWHEGVGCWTAALRYFPTLEQELTHVFPSSCVGRSATLVVFPSNAEVNGTEVCRRGVCPDLAEVRCVTMVEGPEYLCSSDR